MFFVSSDFLTFQELVSCSHHLIMYDGCRLLVTSQGIKVDEVGVGVDVVVVPEVLIMEGGMAMWEGAGGRASAMPNRAS